ncbi:MAG: hypothetical protein R8F63_13380 [Acidimicrobiales bacterium]|nr:hypothetical protein [Acidimicrobiales bacterium]
MAETVVIESRFHGPPRSANGGYACGLAAKSLGQPAATVRLHLPPPLNTALEVERSADEVALVGPDGIVVSATAGVPTVAAPSAVSPSEAAALRTDFDLDEYTNAHIFPTCFACGPARDDRDGLRLFPGDAGRDALVAWPWSPHESVGDEDGLVDVAVLWAALDCPSGMAFLVDADPGSPGMVLGTMTARVLRRAATGESLVVGGWRVASEGRRRMAGSVIWDETGDILALAETVWILLKPEQLASMA